MFKHSVKVPRLYKVAATVAKEVSEGLGSVKQLVYEKQKKHPNIKAIYALVATLFQKNEELETILKRSQFFTKEPRLDIWLAKILIVELVWGRKTLPGQSKPESTVRAYEQIFKAHLSDDKSNSTETVDVQANLKPRYVRVNTLLLTLNDAVEGFRDEGWVLSHFVDKTDYKGFLNKIISLNEDEFLIDIHIPNLLIFPPKTQFYNHPAYKDGSIILQDKASCLPVHILGATPGSKVLDMCAAPGMKTTHLAAVLNDNGTVYAVERDPRRFETLNKIIESSRAKCIQSYNKDVLTCTTQEFAGVEYILVDPSCSGSGMTDRLESQVKEGQNRLVKLTGFQIKILRSALTKFPDVKRVVYSTCSVYPEENEDVVRQVLETNYNFKLVPANQYVGETWHNFGSPEYGDIGKFCLYAKPNEDFTNGFFVAVFERLKEGEENQFFNTKIFNFKKHIQAREKRRDKKIKLEEETQNAENSHPHGGNEEEVEEQYNADKVTGDVEENTDKPQKKRKRAMKKQEESYDESVKNHHIQEINDSKRKQNNLDELVIEGNRDTKTEIKIKNKHKKKMEEPQKKRKRAKKEQEESNDDAVNNQHTQDIKDPIRKENDSDEEVIEDNGDTKIEIKIRNKHKKKMEENTEESQEKRKRAKKEQGESNDDSVNNQHTQDIKDPIRKENNSDEVVIEDNEYTKIEIKKRNKHKKKMEENTDEPQKKRKRAKKEQGESNDDSVNNQHTQEIKDLIRKENDSDEIVIDDNSDTKTEIKIKKHKKKHRKREDLGITEENEQEVGKHSGVTLEEKSDNISETSSQKGENIVKKKKRKDKKCLYENSEESTIALPKKKKEKI